MKSTEEPLKAFGKFKRTLQNVKTTRQLCSLLINCQPTTVVKKHGERNIKIQPYSILRRQVGATRGAVTSGKGRKPICVVHPLAKRPRHLAANIASSQTNGKSH